VLWSATSSPRVVITSQYKAIAFTNLGQKGGFTASIYDNNNPGCPECTRWGNTINAALRCVIEAFDPEAKLPSSILDDADDITLSDYQTLNEVVADLLAACEMFVNAVGMRFCETTGVHAAYKAACDAIHKAHAAMRAEENG